MGAEQPLTTQMGLSVGTVRRDAIPAGTCRERVRLTSNAVQSLVPLTVSSHDPNWIALGKPLPPTTILKIAASQPGAKSQGFRNQFFGVFKQLKSLMRNGSDTEAFRNHRCLVVCFAQIGAACNLQIEASVGGPVSRDEGSGQAWRLDGVQTEVIPPQQSSELLNAGFRLLCDELPSTMPIHSSPPYPFANRCNTSTPRASVASLAA